MRYLSLFFLVVWVCSCKVTFVRQTEIEPYVKDSIVVVEKEKPDAIVLKTFEGLADTTFVRLADFSHDFTYDLRYATTNNFLKTKVYDCAECYTRVKTAKALLAANAEFMSKGYRIKLFDFHFLWHSLFILVSSIKMTCTSRRNKFDHFANAFSHCSIPLKRFRHVHGYQQEQHRCLSCR